MFDAARKRRFDVLLVWRYDRFARSMQELVNALQESERGASISSATARTLTPRPRRAS